MHLIHLIKINKVGNSTQVKAKTKEWKTELDEAFLSSICKYEISPVCFAFTFAINCVNFIHSASRQSDVETECMHISDNYVLLPSVTNKFSVGLPFNRLYLTLFMVRPYAYIHLILSINPPFFMILSLNLCFCWEQYIHSSIQITEGCFATTHYTYSLTKLN